MSENNTRLEYEITMSPDVNGIYDYESLNEAVKKICEEHADKKELKIKIVGLGF